MFARHTRARRKALGDPTVRQIVPELGELKNAHEREGAARARVDAAIP